MSVMVANASHLESILKLRRRLWPDCTEEEHQSELKAMLEGRHPMVADWPAVVMVSEEDDGVSGYMEATLRPYVDGCKEGPVGFIEGWFTEEIPHAREVFQLLLDGIALWTKAHGGLELMCDVPTDQAELLAKHEASGFEKVQRMVMISKPIDSD